MIAKRVQRRTGDNYGRLARYLAAASDPGEKLDQLWMVNCDAGDSIDDLELAIIEIEATQAQNTRATSDKTYHLILSFRHDQPDAEALRQIEWQFAAALGFGQHQRIVATHINTDNFHMHIAFNKTHPETGRCITPFRDFEALEATCRAVERQYGLSVDNGRAETRDQPAMSSKAQDFEAHRWEQSFVSWAKTHAGELTMACEEARNWEDLHHAFDRLNLGIKPSGAGLVIYDLADPNNRMKASDLGRNFSKHALENQLGAFEAMKGTRRQNPRRYRRRPLTRHPDTPKLWRRYLRQQSMQTSRLRKDSLARGSLIGRFAGSWRDFLMTEAIHDPLALAILMMQRQIFGALSPSPSRKPLSWPRDRAPRPMRRPVALDDRFYLTVPFADKDKARQAGALFDKRRKAWWVKKSDLGAAFVAWMKNGKPPVAQMDRFYLTVPFDERNAAKLAGAIWDGKQKAWYRHSDDDSGLFTKWEGDGQPPAKAPKRVYIEVPWRDKDAAREAGARWDFKAQSWFYTADLDQALFEGWNVREVRKQHDAPSMKR